MDDKKHVRFQGRLVFVGFGSIGQGTLPLILRHIDMPRDRITILTADDRGQKEAEEYGVRFVINPITRENVDSDAPTTVHNSSNQRPTLVSFQKRSTQPKAARPNNHAKTTMRAGCFMPSAFSRPTR